jgi:hypothetical protein
MAQAQQPPDLNIPHSDATVDVSIIDTTSHLSLPSLMLIEPELPGFNTVKACCYGFLIKHSNTSPQSPNKYDTLIFDLGIRKDWENSAASIVEQVTPFKSALHIEKDVATILRENGQSLDEVGGIVWSHWHFDHPRSRLRPTLLSAQASSQLLCQPSQPCPTRQSMSVHGKTATYVRSTSTARAMACALANSVPSISTATAAFTFSTLQATQSATCVRSLARQLTPRLSCSWAATLHTTLASSDQRSTCLSQTPSLRRHCNFLSQRRQRSAQVRSFKRSIRARAARALSSRLRQGSTRCTMIWPKRSAALGN